MADRDKIFHCDHCSGSIVRLITAPMPPTVTELGSKYHGHTMRKDMQKVLKRRSRDDLLARTGEIIEKHGLDTVKRSGLLKDGRRKTKWDEK